MVRIPQYLSLPPRFVWFDMDDLIVGFIPFTFALLFNFNMLVTFIISGVLIFLYKQNKEKFSRGFLFHIAYMMGAKFQGYESVHTRRYRE
jgi:type IV conjugative transfer system protein TraL